jgi:hypothetical protein
VDLVKKGGLWPGAREDLLAWYAENDALAQRLDVSGGDSRDQEGGA